MKYTIPEDRVEEVREILIEQLEITENVEMLRLCAHMHITQCGNDECTVCKDLSEFCNL